MEIYFHNTKQVGFKGVVFTVPSIVKFMFVDSDGSIWGSTVLVEPCTEGFFSYTEEVEDTDAYLFPLGHYGNKVGNWDTTLEEV